MHGICVRVCGYGCGHCFFVITFVIVIVFMGLDSPERIHSKNNGFGRMERKKITHWNNACSLVVFFFFSSSFCLFFVFPLLFIKSVFVFMFIDLILMWVFLCFLPKMWKCGKTSEHKVVPLQFAETDGREGKRREEIESEQRTWKKERKRKHYLPTWNTKQTNK